jgi:hypothetical protein
MATIATESGHWYDQSGLPKYTIIGAKGQERNTTLRDARKVGLVPSVTTILSVLAKPGLERWKMMQLLQSALTLPMNEGESLDAYAVRVMADSQEQGAKARDLGTEIHGSIERHFLCLPYDNQPRVAAALAVLPQGQEWSAEKSFASDLGFGGKCDLHSDEWVIDFKTKEFSSVDDLKIWDEHGMQLAAYRFGLGKHYARCAICYVSTTNDMAHLIEIGEEELVRGWAMFFHALSFWISQKKYNPSFAKA